jgi:hypothetical protein
MRENGEARGRSFCFFMRKIMKQKQKKNMVLGVLRNIHNNLVKAKLVAMRNKGYFANRDS